MEKRAEIRQSILLPQIVTEDKDITAADIIEANILFIFIFTPHFINSNFILQRSSTFILLSSYKSAAFQSSIFTSETARIHFHTEFFSTYKFIFSQFYVTSFLFQMIFRHQIFPLSHQTI